MVFKEAFIIYSGSLENWKRIQIWYEKWKPKNFWRKKKNFFAQKKEKKNFKNPNS
ncbi:hypothetical protein ACFFWB_26840 [Flavobacterium procerum]|uniref:hypothetical protein n=1 Tax=Flavobacterium procerum TaxID=1455569 RepID=UPI0035E955D5